MANERARQIAQLNDRFRKTRQGHGMLMITQGIKAEGDDFVFKVLGLVTAFDNFSKDNDPHAEHDFGSLDIDGRKVFWKIDYYTPDLSAGSEDPADEQQTCRVLTVMFAEEY